MSWSRPWAVAVAIATAALAVVAALAIRVTGAAGVPHETGWLSPIFAPDGRSIYAVRRDVRAIVTGFGYSSLTPPATVRLLRDRIDIVSIRLSDGRVTVVEALPPTPFEGTKMETYHGALFGEARAHLRWADAAHLDYEIVVVKPEIPQGRSFLARKAWNPKTQTSETTPPWTAGWSGAGGIEPQRLAGDLEVIDPPGAEAMGCAVVVLRQGEAAAHAVAGSSACRSKYADYAATALAEYSHRADIERTELIRKTRERLIAEEMRQGVPEGQAMLDANDELSRLGFYPRQPMLTAARGACGNPSETFDISDEEITVGLFPDLEKAMASPGKRVHPSAPYHPYYKSFTTTQRINAWLEAGHATFFARIDGECWKVSIEK
jgi:hypothetical protein